MNSNLNSQEYNYDYSSDNIPFNTSVNKIINSARINWNNSYILQKQNKQISNNNAYFNDNTINNNLLLKNQNHNIDNNSNIVRISNLEDRMFSLEKMLQYLDEFIHLKEEEKNNNQLNILIEPLIIKINILEKEIKNLKKEKEENKKQISELNNKIINLEKKIENYNYNEMQDIIYSLSDKEKKLNLLINDFSDITKESNIMIDNKMNEKINEINIFNENRINELLVLIHDINKIIEENEIKIHKFNDNAEKIQKDNINIIKYISVQEQKFNSFELIINEINNLKEKFCLLNDFNYNNKIEDNLKQNLLK